MTVAPSTRSNSESDASYADDRRRKASGNHTASTSESDLDMDEGEDEIDSSSDVFEQDESDDWSDDVGAKRKKQPTIGPEVLREHRSVSSTVFNEQSLSGSSVRNVPDLQQTTCSKRQWRRRKGRGGRGNVKKTR